MLLMFVLFCLLPLLLYLCASMFCVVCIVYTCFLSRFCSQCDNLLVLQTKVSYMQIVSFTESDNIARSIIHIFRISDRVYFTILFVDSIAFEFWFVPSKFSRIQPSCYTDKEVQNRAIYARSSLI